jgi:hypothetical protein
MAVPSRFVCVFAAAWFYVGPSLMQPRRMLHCFGATELSLTGADSSSVFQVKFGAETRFDSNACNVSAVSLPPRSRLIRMLCSLPLRTPTALRCRNNGFPLDFLWPRIVSKFVLSAFSLCVLVCALIQLGGGAIYFEKAKFAPALPSPVSVPLAILFTNNNGGLGGNDIASEGAV